jgi:hypothetical protein
MAQRRRPAENQTHLPMAEAEGQHAGNFLTLGNLCRVVGATIHEANVLRWIWDRNGGHVPVEIEYEAVAASPWLGRCSAKTVSRAVQFWLDLRAIVVEAREERGRPLPSRAIISWPGVFALLIPRDDTPRVGHETRTVSPDMGTHSPDMGTLSPPQSPDIRTPSPTHSPAERETHYIHAHGRALARARGLLSDCLTVTVVVDDSQTEDSDERPRAVPWSEVRELAERSLAAVFPTGRTRRRFAVFAAAAVLAKLVLSERWLSDACRAVGEARPENRDKYFLGCLRNNLDEVEHLFGGHPPPRAELLSYFGSLFRPAERAVERFLPRETSPIGDTPPVAERRMPSPSEREEFRAALRADRAALNLI